MNSLFIIRSAGERTVDLCEKLLLEQGVPKGQIAIVNEVPFSAAMKKSFQLGIDSGFKFTFCVDADVLLRPGSVQHMIEEFEKRPNNICEIQGLILDKFFGGPRPGGIHIYRTSLLPEVIKRIPEEGVNIRPESHTLQQMKKDGYDWIEVPYIVGIHDDEQYNFDIYRKNFVQAVKHIQLAELFVKVWKENLDRDNDFKVALKAFSDSILSNEVIYIDKNQSVYHEHFYKTGFGEKQPLVLNDFNLQTIEERIVNWVEPEIYSRKFPTKFGLVEPKLENAHPSIIRKIKNQFKRMIN
jgi:hypothetical protein